MKKTIIALLIIACSIVLSGCTTKNDLVGVYSSHTSNTTIVLYADGNFSSPGLNNATWKYQSDVVTVTVQRPDDYYFNVHLDDDLSDIEMGVIAVQLGTIDNIESINLEESNRVIRVKLNKSEIKEQTRDDILSVKGIKQITEDVVEKSYSFILKIVDDCLVNEAGAVFQKISNK